jgi:hypothetical protein
MRYLFVLATCCLLWSFNNQSTHNKNLKLTTAKTLTDFPVNYTNTSPDTYWISFYNTSTSQTYYFTVPPNSSGNLGTIPYGTYNLTINPGDPLYWHYYVVSCGYSTTHKGTSYTFYNAIFDDICTYLQFSGI